MPENIKSKLNDFHDIYIDNENDEQFETSKAEEAANQIVEAAKMTGNEITYGEINAMIADSNFDKDALEEIYDLVESKNVSIIETREPNASELEDDDVDDDEILELELEEDDLLNDEEDEKKSGVSEMVLAPPVWSCRRIELRKREQSNHHRRWINR